MSFRSRTFLLAGLLLLVLIGILLWRSGTEPKKATITIPPAPGPDSAMVSSAATDSMQPGQEKSQADTPPSTTEPAAKPPVGRAAPETAAKPSERTQAAADTAVASRTPASRPSMIADTAKASAPQEEPEQTLSAEEIAAPPDTSESRRALHDTAAAGLPVPDEGKTQQPEKAIAPDAAKAATALPDTMARAQTSEILPLTADSTVATPPLEDTGLVRPAEEPGLFPDTSGLEQAQDTMANIEAPAEAPSPAADTTTAPDLISFMSETPPSGLDVTKVSLPDTMIGKTYTARFGETMFTMEREQPFAITYSYRFAGLDANAFRVDLITEFMDAKFRSSFYYPTDGSEAMTVGPYDTRVESVDSSEIVFQLLGYTQLPEAQIPEPTEEVAQAREKKQEAQVQAQPQAQPQQPRPPGNSREFFSRGYALASAAKYDEAKKDLATSLKSDSLNYQARLLLGWILANQGDSTAIDLLRECQQVKPEDADAMYLLAYALGPSDSLDRASQMYAKLIEKDSTNARAYFQLASLSREGGDSVEAEAYLTRARQLEPTIDSVSARPPLPDMARQLWWAEQMPGPVHVEQPVYPDSAQIDSLGCTVEVDILVDEKGTPAEVKIGKPCDKPILNQAAEDAARKCTFTPGKVNGKPAPVWISQPFEFKPPHKAPQEEPPEQVSARADTSSEGEIPPDNGLVPPKLLKMIPPEYPLQKTRYRGTLTVPLKVLVGLDGSVSAVRFVPPDTIEAAFTVAAEASARKCLFRPGLRDGKPDTMWTDLPLVFNPRPVASKAGAADSSQASPEADREQPTMKSDSQEKAAAFVQATMLAQQGNYNEAMAIVMKQLESDPTDNNAQMLYGLIILSKETGKRMDEVSSHVQGTDQGYWWVDGMPQLKEQKQARQPDDAKGTVLLYVLVNDKGAVEKARVVSSSGDPGLDAAAEEAAQGCMFTPGTLQGQPVKVWARLPYTFGPAE